jgi:hypothetical protein
MAGLPFFVDCQTVVSFLIGPRERDCVAAHTGLAFAK